MKKSISLMLSLSLVCSAFSLVFISESYNKVSAVVEYLDDSNTSDAPLICKPHDIVKYVHNGTEEILFADMSLGSFLILPERPASDEELIKTIKEPKANIHYCYFEKEDLIVSYNYNTNIVSNTEYEMNVKYIIDADAKTISDAVTNEVIQDLNKSKEYWVTWEKDGLIRKQVWQLYENEFVSPVDVFEVLSGDTDINGVIDVSDTTKLSLALLEDLSLTADQKLAADVDGDGTVTIADLARLQQYLSKKIDKL